MSNNVQLLSSTQLEKEKKNIYMHPLFPLLKLLFEKCELATVNPESINQENFNHELRLFIEQNEENFKPALSQNSVLDELILKSIQVLRIHLLELEKVNDLCKDFCQRYISCLKVKLNSDNIFKNEFDNYNSDENDDLINNDTCDENNLTNDDSNDNDNENTSYMDANNKNKDSFENISNTNNNSGFLNGNTPLSQIGCNGSTNSLINLNLNHSFIDYDDDTLNRRKSKRGILPKNATNIMKQWLFQHIVHPYPTEEEKKQIALQTNLTLIQVNNWFINARRRILQPMLEASNPNMTKKKKSTTISSKPYQNNRYWPPNLANMALKTNNSSGNQFDKTKQTLNNNSKSFNKICNENCDDEGECENDDDDDDDNDDIDDDSYGIDDMNNINKCEELNKNHKNQNIQIENDLNHLNKIDRINEERNMCNALKIENLLNNGNYYVQNIQNNTLITPMPQTSSIHRPIITHHMPSTASLYIEQILNT